MRTAILVLAFINLYLGAQEWEVSVEENESVTISIEGNISAGDKHRIVLVPFTHEPCFVAHSYFSNYSAADKAITDIETMPSKYLLAVANEKEKFLVTASVVNEFGLGSIMLFYASSNTIADLLDYYSGEEVISIELLDFWDYENQEPLNLNIADYFDIPQNTWNLDGLAEALESGKEKCLASNYAQ
tara:strand:+ start:503 stop:1063 length:561 start_codon:yes stop_codon:yes gene_type:complete